MRTMVATGSGVDAAGAHGKSTGSGVTVAVLDTGQVANHGALSSRSVAGYDFTAANDHDGSAGRDSDTAEPVVVGGQICSNGATPRQAWHGTHVASSVAGRPPGAKIQPVPVGGHCGILTGANLGQVSIVKVAGNEVAKGAAGWTVSEGKDSLTVKIPAQSATTKAVAAQALTPYIELEPVNVKFVVPKVRSRRAGRVTARDLRNRRLRPNGRASVPPGRSGSWRWTEVGQAVELSTRAVVVHGGMHKTGSSAVQNFCVARHEQLKVAGWLYPRAGLVDDPATGIRHRHLMTQARDRADFSSWVELRREIEEWPGRVLISHENFFSPQVDPRVVARLLTGRDVFVVTYVRHPVDYLESCYREWVRRWRFCGSVRDFYGRRAHYFDIPSIATAWSELLGPDRVLLRPYGSEALAGGSTVADFLAALGIPVDSDEVSAPRADNPSLNSRQIQVHHVANRLALPPDAPNRGLLTSLVASEAERDRVTGLLHVGQSGYSPALVEALLVFLAAPIDARSRIMDDDLVAEVTDTWGAPILETLRRHGDPDATLGRSRLASGAVDTHFADPTVQGALTALLAG